MMIIKIEMPTKNKQITPSPNFIYLFRNANIYLKLALFRLLVKIIINRHKITVCV